jgi:hypothetical protein
MLADILSSTKTQFEWYLVIYCYSSHWSEFIPPNFKWTQHVDLYPIILKLDAKRRLHQTWLIAEQWALHAGFLDKDCHVIWPGHWHEFLQCLSVWVVEHMVVQTASIISNDEVSNTSLPKILATYHLSRLGLASSPQISSKGRQWCKVVVPVPEGMKTCLEPADRVNKYHIYDANFKYYSSWFSPVSQYNYFFQDNT